jgi:hypothetical protein
MSPFILEGLVESIGAFSPLAVHLPPPNANFVLLSTKNMYYKGSDPKQLAVSFVQSYSFERNVGKSLLLQIGDVRVYFEVAGRSGPQMDGSMQHDIVRLLSSFTIHDCLEQSV